MRQKRKATAQPTTSRLKPYFPCHYTHPGVFLLWGHLYASLFPAICFNVLREVIDYYPKPVFLAEIYRHRLYIVDVFSCMALSVPMKLAEHRLFMLDKGHILCAGDNLQHRDMYLLSYFPLALSKLQEMAQWSQVRAYAYYDSDIYVFQDRYTDSEKYSVVTGQWRAIAGCRVLERVPDFTVVWKQICLMYVGHSKLLQFDFRTEEVREQRMRTEVPWCCLAGIRPDDEGSVVVICEFCEIRIVNLAELTQINAGAPVHAWRWPRTNSFTALTSNSLYWIETKSLELRSLNLTTKEKRAIRWVPSAAPLR